MLRQPGFLLLDRDGVINEDRDDYVKSIDELRIVPGAPEAIARACAAGYSIAVVSNQQGVALRLVTEASLQGIERAIRSAVDEAGGEIAEFRYCRHLKQDGCDCRKPKPGMILDLASKHGFDPADTYFIGDTPKDLLAARAAGCPFILVLTGYTKAGDVGSLPQAPKHVAADLAAAIDWLLTNDAPIG